MTHRKRIVLTTFGSLGDLHPHLAVALGLRDRGHEPILATSEYYRQKIEALGLGFRAVRPDFPDPQTVRDMMPGLMHARKGTERIIRELLMPVVRQSYEDLLAAVDGADLLVSHVVTYAAPLVAEKTGIAWASAMISPIGFLSAFDPPVLAPAPWYSLFRSLGPWFHRPMFRLLKWSVRSWAEPWHQLRTEIGLPPTRANPVFDGQHSPRLVLALFSPLLGNQQPDWPPRTVVTGFPFYDRHGSDRLPADLARFLDAGPPPIVFTLGSAAVMDAGTFYEHSAEAARLLGRRAVLLVGTDSGNRPAALSDGVLACDYAPFSELFPRAAAIVHQGGIGTTGQAMRSGRPMLVMPYAHDQPDNAARVTRLGIARTISRRRYIPARVAKELKRLLDDPSYSKRAAEVSEQVHKEDGVQAAGDALEGLFAAMPQLKQGSK